MVLGSLKDSFRAPRPELPLARLLRERHNLTWNEAKRLVAQGKVHVEGALCQDPWFSPEPGALISVDTDRKRPGRRCAVGPELIVHQDPMMLVVEKPSGIVSVPPTRTGETTLVEALSSLLGEKLLPVHRLDHGTSGLMLFARNREAAAIIEEMMKLHQVRRGYQALVHGIPQSDLTLDQPIDVRRAGASRPDLIPALTRLGRVTPLDRDLSLVECWPGTGRWHQLRIHLANLGHPILGDKDHGNPSLDKPFGKLRLMLHSFYLEMETPWSRGRIKLISANSLPPIKKID